MFKAEESKASEGPKAYLLQGTPDPLGSVVAFSAMYTGKVIRNKADVTDEERRYHLEEMRKTKLKAPLEAVNLHFMIEGVTRSFTHQMVRQRTAVYAQESLRFAVKEDAGEAVALPPSIMGTESYDEWDQEGQVSKQQEMRYIWDDAVDAMSQAYNQIINMGMPAEDARGLLPHNITTRLNYATNLRSLQDHAGNRLCTQAQFEWRLVWSKMIKAMRNYCTNTDHRNYEHPAGDYNPWCDNWQWQEISQLFKPICYLTGKCEFKADFDRACSIRDRVDANASIGRASSKWGEEYVVPGSEGGKVHLGMPVFPWGRVEDGANIIPAIRPEEWLADPAAAR